MPFNRINGFYFGNWLYQETKSMTLEERNDEVNKALEARFSQLNAALETHEAKLKAMMVPVDTWAMYHSYTDEDLRSGETHGEYQYYIGMIKLRGVWRLCHSYCYFPYSGLEEDFDWKPLVEISIEDRIKAAEHIEKLREAIVLKKEKLIPDVEKAIATLAHSLNRYGQGDK
jgi:hypothetical protein